MRPEAACATPAQRASQSPTWESSACPCSRWKGSFRGMTFQAALFSKPLCSVKRICAAGHHVVFDEDGSYIENKTTGEVNMLSEDTGNYMLDMWVCHRKQLNGGRQVLAGSGD